MHPDVFVNVIKQILFLSAFTYGLVVMIKRKHPLYFRLLFFGVGCFLLENMYYLANYICSGGWASDFSFALFGAGGCYAFMLSANFVLSELITSDEIKKHSSARIIGHIAPILLLLIFFYGINFWASTQESIQGSIISILVVLLSKIAAFPAGYYHLRNLVSNDNSKYTKSLRLCNMMVLCVIFTDFISDLLYTIGRMYEASAIGIFLPLFLLGMMVTADKGVQKWEM